ncbi:Mitogen-activated protein kinase kinase kinase 7, partial [Fragariocoptes setiger]
MPATNQNNNTALRVQVDSRMSPALSSPLEFVTEIPRKEVHLLREFIGQGSYGTVVKGSWRGRYVAVKIYKTDEERESFAVEVKQLSRVNHPNIVKLYGASTQAELTYLVMEYAEGGSLNHLLHDAQHIEYDLRHAISWAMQMALGVAYLHDIRIMHRDLKPANLLLFASGTVVKICDFGTACVLRTQMTNNTGSASYMAPEGEYL